MAIKEFKDAQICMEVVYMKKYIGNGQKSKLCRFQEL